MNITRFILSKNPNLVLLKVLAGLCILFLALRFWRGGREGFVGGGDGDEDGSSLLNQKYVLKRNQDIYDDFYARVYDAVRQPPTQIEREIDAIVKATQPSRSASVFLDVGVGNGALAAALQDRGFTQVYSLNKHAAMVKGAKCSSDKIVCGDAEDAMTFEPNVFTHILCLNTAFYEIPDRIAFFRNAHYWLKSGGVLVIHLLDPAELNRAQPRIIHAGNYGLTYTRNIMADKTDGDYRIVETFEDGQHRLREQETEMHVPNAGDVVNDAAYCRFSLIGKDRVDGGDGGERGALYFFQKI